MKLKNPCAAHWMNQWITDSTDQWISGSKNQHMNQWITESMNQWFNSALNQWNDKIKQQPSLKIFEVQMHILPTSSSKSDARPSVFKHVEVQAELSPQSCAFFADHIFEKMFWRCQFFNILKCKSSCHTGAHFPSTTFTAWGPEQPEQQKHRPYYGDPTFAKNVGFRVRLCSHPWIHMFPNCYTSQLLENLLDNRWLTWEWLTRWWECQPWISSGSFR